MYGNILSRGSETSDGRKIAYFYCTSAFLCLRHLVRVVSVDLKKAKENKF